MTWQRNIKRLRAPGRRRRQAGKASASLATVLKLLKAGSVIVDLGCGESGDRQIAQKKGMQAFGIDLLPVSQHNGFIQANATDLPFADNSIDAIVCHAMIALISPWDRWAVFNEAARVLKPNGILSLTGYPLSDGFQFSELTERWRINAVGFHYVRVGLFRRCAQIPCPKHPPLDSIESIQASVQSLCDKDDKRFIKVGTILVALLAVGLKKVSRFTGYLDDDVTDVLDGMINTEVLIDADKGHFDLPWLDYWREGKEVEGNISFVLDVLAICGEIKRYRIDGELMYQKI